MKRQQRKRKLGATRGYGPGEHRPLRSVAPYLVIVVSVVLVFGRTVTFGYTNWDDDINIYGNPLLVSPSWRGFTAVWSRPYENLYVPLVYTGFLFETLAFGMRPGVMHTTNLVLHMLAACCAYFVLVRVAGSRRAALLGALLFAVHPLQAEPVAWLTGRKDVLAGVLTLASLAAFTAWEAKGTALRYSLATACFVAALFAKPSALTTPLLALALAVHLRIPRARVLRALAPWFVLSASWVLVSLASQREREVAAVALPFWGRPFLAADCLWYYALKTVLPVSLTPIAPRTIANFLASPWSWAALPATLGVALWLKRHHGAPALAGVWFAAALLPVLGLTSFRYQQFAIVADRYAYVALLGAGLALVAVAQSLMARFAWHRNAVFAAVAILVAAYGAAAFRQAGFWRNSVSLWSRQLAVTPRNSHALYNLATDAAERGEKAQAVELLERLLANDPSNPKALTNMMVLARETGHQPLLADAASRGARLTTGTVESAVARGLGLLESNNPVQAAAALRVAANMSPGDPDVFGYLGNSLARAGDYAGAERAFRRAVELAPHNAAHHGNLGLALVCLGRTADACESLQRALKLEPGNPLWLRKLREANGQQ